MISFGKRTVMLPLAAAATLALGLPPANAQGFLDMLLGEAPAQSRPLKGDFPPPPAKKKSPPAAAARISSPTYNTYKSDALVRVDFSALKTAMPDIASVQPAEGIAETASFEPAKTDASFKAAAAGLDGYELFAESGVAKALMAYYSANPDFIWVSGGEANDRAREVLRVLGDAASYGLSPADYAVSVPDAGETAGDAEARQKALIRFEMALSARVLRYARDAQNGRVEPNRISGYYDFPAKPLDLVGRADNAGPHAGSACLSRIAPSAERRIPGAARRTRGAAGQRRERDRRRSQAAAEARRDQCRTAEAPDS